jgi:hypothetical protein
MSLISELAKYDCNFFIHINYIYKNPGVEMTPGAAANLTACTMI